MVDQQDKGVGVGTIWINVFGDMNMVPELFMKRVTTQYWIVRHEY